MDEKEKKKKKEKKKEERRSLECRLFLKSEECYNVK